MGEGAPAVDAESLIAGGKATRLIIIHGHDSGLASILVVVGLALAVLYGAAFFRRPPSPAKTVIKTGAVAALVLSTWLDRDPWLLTLALCFCALGDAFLAGDPKRWLPYGLASFLAGHLAYVALFITRIVDFQQRHAFMQAGDVLPLTVVRFAVMGATALVAAAMLAWLWGSLGNLKAPVTAYAVAIVAMVCGSLILPPFDNGAQYGALAFFASDGILSAQLFKQRFTGLAGQWAVWGLYFVGQLIIVTFFSPAVA